MDKIIIWIFIIGALYGFVAFVYAAVTDIARLVKYIKDRRHHISERNHCDERQAYNIKRRRKTGSGADAEWNAG